MHAIARRLPAITALSLAAIVAVLASGLLVRLVEARSLSDVAQVLRIGGYDWASVSVDGLQVHLTGTAPSEAVRFRALTAAGTVVDSARVIDDIQVVEAKIEAPDFAIEILRNDAEISLIGLVPKAMPRQALLDRIRTIAADGEITDLLETADYPAPANWQRAVDFGLTALAAVPRAKISIAADLVQVSGMADSLTDQRRLESQLARSAPEGLRVALEILAPRPAITPFTLRFLIDADGMARFDACSADTAEARDRIVKAAVAAGMQGKAACVIGLGAPSPRWGEAAALAIAAVRDLGPGTKVTISDADVSLVAPASVKKAAFDTVTGKLDNALPDAFSLHAVLTEPDRTGTVAAGEGPPEVVATLAEDGTMTMRGKVADARSQAAIDGFARAAFGAGKVENALRLDPSVPEGWPIRVLAALEALKDMARGSATVRPDTVEIVGVTGNPNRQAEVSGLLSKKLGEGADFKLDIAYDKKLDPVLGLPTAEECVADINAAIAAKKVNFDPGSADLDSEAGATLDKIAALMKNCADYPMEIGGHTDSQGREEMNQELSQSRAEAVLEALVARRVDTSNLTARGYGETRPIADNGSEAGREANRRIEFRLVNDQEGDTEATDDDDTQ
jgi:OOP family OmpA-OmpF porin